MFDFQYLFQIFPTNIYNRNYIGHIVLSKPIYTRFLRIYVYTSVKVACMQIQIYGEKIETSQSSGMNIESWSAFHS